MSVLSFNHIRFLPFVVVLQLSLVSITFYQYLVLMYCIALVVRFYKCSNIFLVELFFIACESKKMTLLNQNHSVCLIIASFAKKTN